MKAPTKKADADKPVETDFHAINREESEAGHENAGAGGSYEIIDGKRVLVERTQPGSKA